jgi:hypothetical protein
MIGEGISRHYAPEHDPPLGGYALLLGAHLGLVGAALFALNRRGAALGEIGAGELLLTGVATFKLSRTISKSWIGTAVRAPFTRYVGQGSGDEVNEVGRGEGVQEAVGDLLTCPFCTGHWVATGLVLGHAAAPGPTRAVTRILAAGAIADTLQYVRGWLVKKTASGP